MAARIAEIYLRETMSRQHPLGRVTESRTDPEWGRPAAPVKNRSWFDDRKYTSDQLSLGQATEREYYAYDATALIIKGHCAYDPVAEALADEGLVPIRTSDGRSLVSIWFNVLRDSVSGAYHEIVISVDATPAGESCETSWVSNGNPYRLLYSNFAQSICRRLFLHTLYIDSPLSIAWGREMQAFPKHPEPVDVDINDGRSCFDASIAWQNDPIIRARVHKRRGLVPFGAQGLGLLAGMGPKRIARFLGSTSFALPIQMPQETAAESGIPPTYLAEIRKGLNPLAVRCWPWSSNDSLELGNVRKATGCEDNNGHNLLRDAGFSPAIVTYMPFMQVYVGADK